MGKFKKVMCSCGSVLYNSPTVPISKELANKMFKECPECNPEGHPKNVGDIWFIRYPTEITLTRVKIGEITNMTVVFMVGENGCHEVRYKISDIEWVEKCKS